MIIENYLHNLLDRLPELLCCQMTLDMRSELCSLLIQLDSLASIEEAGIDIGGNSIDQYFKKIHLLLQIERIQDLIEYRLL